MSTAMYLHRYIPYLVGMYLFKEKHTIPWSYLVFRNGKIHGFHNGSNNFEIFSCNFSEERNGISTFLKVKTM